MNHLIIAGTALLAAYAATVVSEPQILIVALLGGIYAAIVVNTK